MRRIKKGNKETKKCQWGRTHHAAANREVLQRHGAFALGSELDILHVRVHGVVHSCNSAWKYVENPSIGCRKSNSKIASRRVQGAQNASPSDLEQRRHS
jgi:hypothetical protein